MFFLLEIIILAIGCGTIAAVYKNVLAYEPVLNWWFVFGQRFEKRWFYPAIWGCHKCIGGQAGLWAFMFLEVIPWYSEPDIQPWDVVGLIFGLLFTICASILVAIVLTTLINNIEKK